jgi:hypothetical protein
MDDNTSPSSLYIARGDNNHTNEDIRNLNDAGNDNPQWGEDVAASELMSMGTIYVHDARVQNVINARDQNFDGIT